MLCMFFFFFKQKTAYEMRISDWSSDVCSSDLVETVWFQKLVSSDGSIRHSGDNLTGEGDGDDETISIDLTRLPSNVETLVLTVTSFRGQTFDKVKNAFGRVIDLTNNKEFARYDISDSGPYTGLILSSLKRSGGEWVFTASGERSEEQACELQLLMR